MAGTPLHNMFTIEAPIERAWGTLTDIRRIAPCVPGAELTEVIDDHTYKGRIGVTLGPVALGFAGTMRLETLDAVAHRAVIAASGAETKGRGAAQASVVCTLVPVGTGTRVDLETSLILSGTVAQYGRATAMVAAVAQQLVDQFAEALAADMRADAPAPAATAPARDIPLFRIIWQIFATAIGGWFKKGRGR